MDTKEIKLRLIEAFIAQKTPTETIPSEVDKLLEYINKDNSVDLEKSHNDLLEAGRKIEQLNFEEENLRKIYFDFYDKMEEPERSEAKENWSFNFSNRYYTPNHIGIALMTGFPFEDKDKYWCDIYEKYRKYFTN